ncbi:MAG: alpha/beta hydrolase [Acidobacteria bacterium]|nr:alpha/beta hydrolase [Acidobacteriota bacterium]
MVPVSIGFIIKRMKWFPLLAVCAAAQDLQFAELKDFQLTNGQTASRVEIGFRTYGKLDAAKSNAVLFPSWFGGKSENLSSFVGPDKMVDSGRFFVITVDALSNGVSAKLPHITIRDMVNSQHRLLREHFGITGVAAIIGISMGGMQAFDWAVAYPAFAKKIVPIIGSPKLSTPDLLLWQAQLSAIESAVANQVDPRSVMPAVNAIHQFAMRTPEHDAAAGGDWAAIKKSLENVTIDPLNRAAQLRAMMSQNHDLREAVAKVQAKMYIVVAKQDHMVNPRTSLEFAKLGGFPTLDLNGNCGHMALGCESARLTAGVRAFLEQ